MKKFIKEHKKGFLIGGSIFLALLIISIIWLFIVPMFSNNKYGDRLKDKAKYKVDNVDKIKEAIKENQMVDKVEYHEEGRILNFVVTVSCDLSKDDAKSLSNKILDNLSDKNKSYYDIQVLYDCSEDSDVYPIVGYKNKNNDSFSYGNEG